MEEALKKISDGMSSIKEGLRLLAEGIQRADDEERNLIVEAISKFKPIINEEDITFDDNWYIKAPSFPDKEFELVENRIEQMGFRFVQVFGKNELMDFEHKVKTVGWCISVSKKMFVRITDSKEKFTSFQNFQNKIAGHLALRNLGL